MTKQEQIARWRLILGSEVQEILNDFNAADGNIAASGGSSADGNNGTGGKLSKEQQLIDETLAAIYGTQVESFGKTGSKGRGAGNGKSAPVLSTWLGNLRALFDSETVTVVQNDAVERKGLKSLLMERELLDNLEPNIGMAELLLDLKDQIPKQSKESARNFIKKIVENINKLLENGVRQAVSSSLNKKSHSPLPSASAIDFKYTINHNLKNYNQELKTIIPERVWFYDRTAKTNKWNIILDIDQSGSMGESIIYSSIMACILASMNSVQTNVVAFDTEIMDLTNLCSDPVDLLFGFQMGGGTDIAKSISYCQSLVKDPKKTLFFLISDLDEWGSRNKLLERVKELKDSGVTVISLLAIADGGRAYYDATTAARLVEMGVPCFACSPEKLPDMWLMQT